MYVHTRSLEKSFLRRQEDVAVLGFYENVLYISSFETVYTLLHFFLISSRRWW